MYSLDSKKDYLKTFTSHRLPAIIVPWIVVAAIAGVISSIVFGNLGELYDRLGAGLFQMPHWFVTELIMFYLIFYVSFKLFDNRLLTLIVISISCFFMMFFIASYVDYGVFSLSGAGFVLGLWWWQYRDSAYRILTRFNPVCILVTALVLTSFMNGDASILCLSFIVYFLALMVLDKSMKSICYMVIIQLILCVLFFVDILQIEAFAVLTTMFLTKMALISPLKKYLSWGGGIAFELYLLHWSVFIWISEYLDLNPYIMTVIALVISIALSIPVNKFDKAIMKKLTQ